MIFGRTLKVNEQKMWQKCYKIGMSNGWCSGKFARMDGDFITEDDCLNKDSCCAVDDIRVLKAFFKNGNWCLGQSVIYKNLCFMQQVNGGDEWLTMKMFSNGEVISFESITMEPMARDYSEDYDKCYSGYKEFQNGYDFAKYIKDLTKAKLYQMDNKDGGKVLLKVEYGRYAEGKGILVAE